MEHVANNYKLGGGNTPQGGDQTLLPPAGWFEWTEEALYRLPFLYLLQRYLFLTLDCKPNFRVRKQKEALSAFRKYRDASLQWPMTFRMHKRFVIYRSFAQNIITWYQSGDYIPPSMSEAFLSPNAITGKEPKSIRQEVNHLHTLYEEALHRIEKFPRAEETNQRVLEMCELFLENSKALGYGSLSDRRRLVDVSRLDLTKVLITCRPVIEPQN